MSVLPSRWPYSIKEFIMNFDNYLINPLNSLGNPLVAIVYAAVMREIASSQTDLHAGRLEVR
jgi:hypothetical protein